MASRRNRQARRLGAPNRRPEISFRLRDGDASRRRGNAKITSELNKSTGLLDEIRPMVGRCCTSRPSIVHDQLEVRKPYELEEIFSSGWSGPTK
jgi:hypothetical protein